MCEGMRRVTVTASPVKQPQVLHAPQEIVVDGQHLLFPSNAQRAEHIEETVQDERGPVDLASAVFRPQIEVVRHIDTIESLEGGIIPIQVIIGINLFEAFLIIMVRIPQGIVQIDEKAFVHRYQLTSITKYLPKLQKAFSSFIYKVRLPSSSSTNS